MSTPHSPKRRKTSDHDGLMDISPSRSTASPSSIPLRTIFQTTNHVPPTDQTKNGNGGEQVEGNEDWTSSSGSDPDSDSDSAPITTKPGSPPQPNTALHTRLTSFFSSLAEQRANPDNNQPEKFEMDSDSDSGFEDNNEDGEGQRGQYIELDLALGVLSEKGSDDEEEVKVRLPGQDSDEEAENEGDDGEDKGGSGEENGGLAELTNVAVKDNSRSRRKKMRQEQKRKIEEIV